MFKLLMEREKNSLTVNYKALRLASFILLCFHYGGSRNLEQHTLNEVKEKERHMGNRKIRKTTQKSRSERSGALKVRTKGNPG